MSPRGCILHSFLEAGLCIREKFDIVVAREFSVAAFWCLLLVISFTAQYCFPLVYVGGLFIVAEGHDHEDVTFTRYLF